MRKKIVSFGEIMLRLATPGYERFGQASKYVITFCGAEANVAVSLANFGMEAEFVTRLPSNDIAYASLRNLHQYGVDTSNVVFGGERIGLYYLETGAVARPSKIIYDRAHSSIANIKRGMINWEKVLAGADWFHWTGITPALSQSAADVCIDAIKTAKEMNIPVSVDLNYRKNLWKYGKNASEVMNDMVAMSDIILGNEEDAERVFGIKPDNFDAAKTKGNIDAANFLSVCQQMKSRFPSAKKIITTLRGSVNANHNKWSGVLYNGEKLFQSPEYDITHIVDRVGGGDSFMGGLIYSLLNYPEDDQRALNFAAAASCLKHTIYGDFNLSTVQEVENLMEGNTSGRVIR